VRLLVTDKEREAAEALRGGAVGVGGD
jgi:hypothetical protein